MSGVTIAAELLRTWRQTHRWTQLRVSEHLRIPVSNVSHIECGRMLPGLETAVRIERLTDIPPRLWIAGEPDMRKAG